MLAKRSPPQAPTKIECAGTLTEDRTAWATELQRHCSGKYHDDQETAKAQGLRLAKLRSIQRCAELDGITAPKLDVSVAALQARARMAHGKCNGGGEDIVVEMIRQLPVSVVYVIADLFEKRYSGEVCEDVMSWHAIIMIFLPKVPRPRTLKHFRGISLLSVMSKWYMQCLYLLAKRGPKPAKHHHVCIYSYENSLGTRHITTTLQHLMSRGWEWQNQAPIFVFNGDIFAAFDDMRPETIAEALQAAQLHPRLVAALLQETIGLQCAPEFAGVTLDERVPFTKCARQGAVESAFEWNTIMFMCLADLVPLWHESGYGIQLGDRRYTHVVWADNIWLLAHQHDHLQAMITSLTAVLAHHKLAWKPESLCYKVSTADSYSDLTASIADVGHPVCRVEAMEILGAWVTQCGATVPALLHRIAKAEKAFWADKGVLLNKSVPLNLRLKRYYERIVPKVLYSCGSWAWCQSLCQRLVVWEGKCLRRIVGIARGPAETWLAWFRRSTNKARKFYASMGFHPLSLRVLQEVHRTAGLLQRPSPVTFTAARATLVLLEDAIVWRDTWWWHREQAFGQLEDPSGHTGWKHAGNFGNRGST